MDGAIHVFAPENPLTGSGLFPSILPLQPHLIGSQGFYGGFWNLFSDHRTVIGYGYQGAMFQWSETPFSFTEDSLCHLQSLYLTPFFSGHSASSQARFSRYGHLLLSSSRDRTVRVWGCETSFPSRWEEVSRPVVHGYPVTNVVWIQDHTSLDPDVGLSDEELGRLVTINEEKKCRVFTPTFLNLLLFNSLVITADHATHPIKIDGNYGMTE